MKKEIDIGIKLPKDAVTQAIAFIGRRGSGKTYAASKLAVFFHHQHLLQGHTLSSCLQILN